MSKRRAFVRGLILFALAFTNLNDIWSPDVLPNALFAWTAIRERNVDYDEFVFRPNQPSSPGRLDSEAYFFRACGVSTATQPPKAPRSVGGPPAPGPNDHVCSVFPPGMAILALPFFAPLVIAGFDPLDLGLLVRMGHVVGALVEVLATLVLWSCVRRFVGPRWSLVLVLLYFFGTSVRTIASQALWQHSGVHLAVARAPDLPALSDLRTRRAAACLALAGRDREAPSHALARLARDPRAVCELCRVVGRPSLRHALPRRPRTAALRSARVGNWHRHAAHGRHARPLRRPRGLVVSALQRRRARLRPVVGHRAGERERGSKQAFQLVGSAVARGAAYGPGRRAQGHRRGDPESSGHRPAHPD